MRFKTMLVVVFFIAFMGISTPSYSLPSLSDRLILMWQVQKDATDEDMAFLSSKGVNLIQSFAMMSWSDYEVKEYLDKAKKHNLGVIISLAGLGKNEGGESFDWDRARTVVNKWKGHPAVFAWLLFDEPVNRQISGFFQKKVYDFIKNVDPQGKVFLSWNGTAERHYRCCFAEQSFDILDIHAYISEGVTQRQKRLLDKFAQHFNKNYPVIVTLRAFNGPGYPDLPPDGLIQQYDFFFHEQNFTRNVGFYGWELGGGKEGGNQGGDITRQFRELKLR